MTPLSSSQAHVSVDALGSLAGTKFTSPERVGGVIFPLRRHVVSAEPPRRSLRIDPVLQRDALLHSINPPQKTVAEVTVRVVAGQRS